MDAAKLFVIILSAFAIGILVHIELKSRRVQQKPEPLLSEPERDTVRKAPRKSRKG